MKKNGFMMVEAIIAATIVAVFSISIFAFTFFTIKNYETKEKYDVIDDIYKLNSIKKYLINNDYYEDYIIKLETDTYINIKTIKDADGNEITGYNELVDDLKINNLYMVKKENIKDNLNKITDKNEDFKEYINYEDFEISDSALGILLGEFLREEKYYYAYIEMVNE